MNLFDIKVISDTNDVIEFTSNMDLSKFSNIVFRIKEIKRPLLPDTFKCWESGDDVRLYDISGLFYLHNNTVQVYRPSVERGILNSNIKIALDERFPYGIVLTHKVR